jgi:lipopolysaccharide transport system permease protein
MLENLWRQRRLLSLMTQREIAGRYRGSWMGLAWSLATPILMLAVYSFVFSVVFSARWGEDTSGNRAEFAILLFVGLLVHGFFSECLTRAPGLMLAHANLVKKVVFPLEVLPVTVVGSALFNCGVNVLVLLLGMLAFSMPFHWSLLLFPVVLLPLVCLALGVAWFFAALGVYVRDVAQLTGLLSTLLLFLAPVFYPQSALPPEYRPWLDLNPLTFIIESARQMLMGGMLDWKRWCFALLLGIAAMLGGFWCFCRGRRGFADVL